MRVGSISVSEAKKIIVESLTTFNEDLGARAASILSTNGRLNLVEVKDPKPRMMQCRPAGITLEDVKTMDMLIPDFEQKFGPYFTRQDNPEDYAIIDFEYNGTPKAIIWLAHELGHAIADDIQREHDRSFKDYSQSEMEEQAYFVQHIVSNYVRRIFPDLDADSVGENTLTMSFDRASQFTKAEEAYDRALECEGSRKQIIGSALDQKAAGM